MKKSLISFLLFVLVSFQSYPQTLKSGPVSSTAAAFRMSTQLLEPGQRKALFETLQLLSKQLNVGKLNKNNGDTSLYSPIYRPFQIIVDTLDRMTYSYDFPGRLICRLSEKLFNGLWYTSIVDSMTYDNNGNLLTEFSKTYSDGIVTSTFKATYTYDSKGLLQSAIMETHMDFYVIPSMKTTYTYDSAGNLESIVTASAAFNGWTNMYKDTFTYDSKGNILTDLTEVWTNNAWSNDSKDTYTYDGSSSMLTHLSEKWNGSAWENNHRYTWIYNNGSLTSRLDEDWLSNAWTNKLKLTCTYDNKGNYVSDLIEQWTTGAWTNLKKHVYTNDLDGNSIKGESFKWSTDAKWEPGTSPMEFRYTNYKGKKEILPISGTVVTVQYQTPIVNVESTPVTVGDYCLSQNYPNPFNPSTTINYSIKNAGNVKLTVFDALGKRVAVVVDEFKPAGSYSVKFDGRSLPSGMYIYKLEAAEFTTAKKFVLMK